MAVADRYTAGMFSNYYTKYVSDEEILAGKQASCESAEIVGYETIAGERCAIIECDYGGGVRSKICITSEKGFALKVENITSQPAIMEFTDIDLESPIPDS